MNCNICRQAFGDIRSNHYAHHLIPCNHYICHECIDKERRKNKNASVCPICSVKIEGETC